MTEAATALADQVKRIGTAAKRIRTAGTKGISTRIERVISCWRTEWRSRFVLLWFVFLGVFLFFHFRLFRKRRQDGTLRTQALHRATFADQEESIG